MLLRRWLWLLVEWLLQQWWLLKLWRKSLECKRRTCYYFHICIQSNLMVTSIKQSHVLKGHIYVCPVIENFIWIVPLLRGHLSYKSTFSLSQSDLLIQVSLYIDSGDTLRYKLTSSDDRWEYQIFPVYIHCIKYKLQISYLLIFDWFISVYMQILYYIPILCRIQK